MSLLPEQCRGAWVPLVTPFRDDMLDLDTLAKVVEWLLQRGVRGFLALGSTGEAPHLDDEEALHVVRCVVEASRGRVPVLVGAGRPSLYGTLRAIDRFAAAGADAALVITPSYYRGRMQPEVLQGYFERLAAASPLPVFVYYIPQVTSIELDASWLQTVVQLDNIWGFKDSTVCGGPLAETLRRADCHAYVGGGARIVEALDAGARAGILAVAHVLPEVCVRLFAAWDAGHRDEVVRMQAHLRALTEAIEGWTVAGVKWALEQRGLAVGSPRPPLPPAPPAVQDRVRQVLAASRPLIDESTE